MASKTGLLRNGHRGLPAVLSYCFMACLVAGCLHERPRTSRTVTTSTWTQAVPFGEGTPSGKREDYRIGLERGGQGAQLELVVRVSMQREMRRKARILIWERQETTFYDEEGSYRYAVASNVVVSTSDEPGQSLSVDQFVMQHCPVAITLKSRFGSTNVVAQTTTNGAAQVRLAPLLASLAGDHVLIQASAQPGTNREVFGELRLDAKTACDAVRAMYGRKAFAGLPVAQQRAVGGVYTQEVLVALNARDFQLIDELGAGAVVPVARGLQSTSAYTRAMAANAMGRFGGFSAILGLTPMLQDSSPAVRRAAVEGLAAAKREDALSPLVSCLQNDASGYVREAAALALGQFRVPGGQEALMQALDDDWPSVKVAAIVGLGALRASDATTRLVLMAKSDAAYLRAAAATALGSLADAGTVDPLLAMSNDASADPRRAAAAALGSFNEERVVDALIDSLKDKNGYVREAAAASLGRLGNRKAAPALKALAGDDYLPARRAAEKALLSPGF